MRWLYDPSQSAIDADRISTACGTVSTRGITVFCPRVVGVVLGVVDIWKDL